MRIGLDVMGGDFHPQAPLEGALAARNTLDPSIQIVLYGKQDVIDAFFDSTGASRQGFDIVDTPQVIPMDAHPVKGVAANPQSSINLATLAQREGKLDAFISAGSTGALMVASVMGLGLIDGVIRPTVGGIYPHASGHALICDVGTNVDCKPEMLVQFAVLGSIYMREAHGIAQPRVALLNVGEERTKGNQVAQATYPLLEAHPFVHFVGNAEGRDFSRHYADVYVCDGFVGNIILKFGESFYDMMVHKLPNDPDIQRFDFENIGGLPILGVKGHVIVGHGISGPRAFENMMYRAKEIVDVRLADKIQAVLAEHSPAKN